MPHDSSAPASLPRPWLPGTGLALAFEQPSIVTRPFRVPIMSSRRFAREGHIACTSDATILARYGISHCLGDNLGPGAICRGLRSIPVLLDLCHDLEKWAPRAVILNYVAPDRRQRHSPIQRNRTSCSRPRLQRSEHRSIVGAVGPREYQRSRLSLRRNQPSGLVPKASAWNHGPLSAHSPGN